MCVKRGIHEHLFRTDDRYRFRQLDHHLQHQAMEAMTLVCHSSERRLSWRVSRQHHLEFQDPTGQTRGSYNGAWEVGLFEFFHISPASETELQPMFVYWDLTGLQLVGELPRRCLRIVQYSSSKDHLVSYKAYYLPLDKTESVDRNRGADKTGRPRPVSRDSETASFSSSGISRKKTGPADGLLTEGYALSRRLIHKPGRLRQWAIEQPILSHGCGQSLSAAGTRHRQLSRRLLSHGEASRHRRRAGRRPRNTEYGDSNLRGHWYQANRHESQGYRGRKLTESAPRLVSRLKGRGRKRKLENTLRLLFLPQRRKRRRRRKRRWREHKRRS